MSDIWPEITSDTSMEELQAIHKRIWDYVIEHDRKPDTPYFADCIGCEHTRIVSGYELVFPFCPNCPIQWPDGKDCTDERSLYARFLAEPEPSYRLALGKEIRDVEFKRPE